MKYLILSSFLLFIITGTGAERPNIVFVITDDQGYGDLGCTGNPVIKTPHMDALAAESTVFTDYHVAPTCSPTRASLLTGHWANRTGVWHTINGRSMLRANEITIGTLLKGSGYETGMFGKWHLGDNYPYRPEDRGFTEVYRHGGGGVGQTPDYWNNAYFDGHYFHNGNIIPAKGFCTDVFFEASHKFIRNSAAEKKPFFAYIATNAPHGPWHCPQKYMDLYPDQPDLIAAFFGMITNIDDNIAKTRNLLKELGIHENTIFIFTTDNGTARGQPVFNAGMRGTKGSEYDGGHRVPLFIHWPAGGLNQKHEVETLTHAVDIVPTLLDLTDSRKPETLKFDGLSMRPLLKPDSESTWPDRMLITDSQRVVDPIKWRQSAVMSQDYRLVNGTELYEIAKDPSQKNNLAKEQPEQVAKMRAFYDAWWAELEPTFSQTTEIYLGQPGHDKVTLTSHDWILEDGRSPWNQSIIRSASFFRPKKAATITSQSHWAVKVITPGTYQFSLRRWPEEANHPIRSSLPAGENVPGASKAFRATPGVAIPAIQAVLRIDGKEIASKPVGKTDTQITFTADLATGSHQLAPIFKTADENEVGAFYVIVTRVH